MSMEKEFLAKPSLHQAVRHCAAFIVRQLQMAGTGLSQANAGEAGMRAQALPAIKIDTEVQRLNPIPDTVPSEWQTGSQR